MQLMLGPDERVVDVVVDLLAEQVDLQVQVGEALDELLGRLESHAVHSFLAPSGARARRWLPGAGARRCGGAHAVSRCGGAEGSRGVLTALVTHYRKAACP